MRLRIATRKYRNLDLQEIKKWVIDPEIRNNFRFTAHIKSDNDLKSFILRQKRRTIKDSFINLVLYDKKDLKKTYIGNVGLKNIDLYHRNAELTIVIGNKNYWYKNYGQEALFLICNFGFNKLKLHKIYLGVISHNKPAIKSYEKFDFKHEGVKKDQILQSKKYYDEILMAIFDHQFKKHK